MLLQDLKSNCRDAVADVARGIVLDAVMLVVNRAIEDAYFMGRDTVYEQMMPLQDD